MAYLRLNSDIINILNQRALDAIYCQLDLDTMCSLITVSSDFEKIITRIWKHNPLYHDNIHNCLKVSPEGNRVFMSKNAKNFHSLKIDSSDFEFFNEVTKHLEFQHLKTLKIEHDIVNEVIPPDFLKRLTIENIRLRLPTMVTYKQSILKVNTLKSLRIFCKDNDVDSMDDFLNELISERPESIRSLQVKVEEFPPAWLMNSSISKCENLITIALDTRMSQPIVEWCEEYFEQIMPTLKSLKKLWLIGDGYCVRHLAIILDHCPNLKCLQIDRADRIVYLKAMMKLKRSSPGLKVCLSKFKVEKFSVIEFL